MQGEPRHVRVRLPSKAVSDETSEHPTASSKEGRVRKKARTTDDAYMNVATDASLSATPLPTFTMEMTPHLVNDEAMMETNMVFLHPSDMARFEPLSIVKIGSFYYRAQAWDNTPAGHVGMNYIQLQDCAKLIFGFYSFSHKLLRSSLTVSSADDYLVVAPAPASSTSTSQIMTRKRKLMVAPVTVPHKRCFVSVSDGSEVQVLIKVMRSRIVQEATADKDRKFYLQSDAVRSKFKSALLDVPIHTQQRFFAFVEHREPTMQSGQCGATTTRKPIVMSLTHKHQDLVLTQAALPGIRLTSPDYRLYDKMDEAIRVKCEVRSSVNLEVLNGVRPTILVEQDSLTKLINATYASKFVKTGHSLELDWDVVENVGLEFTVTHINGQETSEEHLFLITPQTQWELVPVSPSKTDYDYNVRVLLHDDQVPTSTIKSIVVQVRDASLSIDDPATVEDNDDSLPEEDDMSKKMLFVHKDSPPVPSAKDSPVDYLTPKRPMRLCEIKRGLVSAYTQNKANGQLEYLTTGSFFTVGGVNFMVHSINGEQSHTIYTGLDEPDVQIELCVMPNRLTIVHDAASRPIQRATFHVSLFVPSEDFELDMDGSGDTLMQSIFGDSSDSDESYNGEEEDEDEGAQEDAPKGKKVSTKLKPIVLDELENEDSMGELKTDTMAVNNIRKEIVVRQGQNALPQVQPEEPVVVAVVANEDGQEGINVLEHEGKQTSVCRLHLTNLTIADLQQIVQDKFSMPALIKGSWSYYSCVDQEAICMTLQETTFKPPTDDVMPSGVLVEGYLTKDTVVKFTFGKGVREKLTGLKLGFDGKLTEEQQKAAQDPLQVDKILLEMKLGGMDEKFKRVMKTFLLERLGLREQMTELGIIPSRGLLLWGPSGTGKTRLANCIAKILGCPDECVRKVAAPELASRWVGESERKIRELFEPAAKEQAERGDQARLYVIIIDEIDALLPTRGARGYSSSTDSHVNQFLASIDGLQEAKNVVVIGMTNHKDLIDSSCLRPGRLGNHMHIGLPDAKGRREIYEIYLRKTKEQKLLDETDLDMKWLIEHSDKFSGAQIEEHVRLAVTEVLYEKYDIQPSAAAAAAKCKSKFKKTDKPKTSGLLNMDHFERALEQLKSTSSEGGFGTMSDAALSMYA